MARVIKCVLFGVVCFAAGALVVQVNSSYSGLMFGKGEWVVFTAPLVICEHRTRCPDDALGGLLAGTPARVREIDGRVQVEFRVQGAAFTDRFRMISPKEAERLQKAMTGLELKENSTE